MRHAIGGSSRLRGASRLGAGGRLAAALLVALAAVAMNAVVAPAAAAETGSRCAQTGFESVATDNVMYPPGAVVHMTGRGYASACDVVVRVTRPDGVVETAIVTTDLAGNFEHDYQLLPPPGAVGEYAVDVLGFGDAVLASTTFVDALAATASVDKRISYRNTIANTYTFTITNTSTSSESIGSVQISRPNGEYSITACPQAPSGWTVIVAAASCTYNSVAAANIAAGTSSSSFQVRANIGDGDDDLNKSWSVRVHANDTFGGATNPWAQILWSKKAIW